MKQLIGIYEGYLIDSHELHAFLKVKTPHQIWMLRQLENFKEGIDYWSFVQKSTKSAGRPKNAHFLTIDTAKQLSMMAKTEVGEQVRKYFISVEKRVKELDKLILSKELLKEETKLNDQDFKTLDNEGLTTFYDNQPIEDINAHILSIKGRDLAQEITRFNIADKALTLKEYIEEHRKSHLETRTFIIEKTKNRPESLPIFQLKKIEGIEQK